MHVKALASNRLAKASRASHGPRVMGKERVKKTMENPKDPKVPKAHERVKHWKLVPQVLKTRNRRQARKLRNQRKWDMFDPLTRRGFMMAGVMRNGMTAGVMMNGMMTGVRLGWTKVLNKRMTIPKAHSHLEVLISVP